MINDLMQNNRQKIDLHRKVCGNDSCQLYEELELLNKQNANLIRALNKIDETDLNFINNLPIGYYRADPGLDGEIITGNPALLKMFGYKSYEEALGKKVSEFYYYPADRKRFSDLLMAKGSVLNQELLLKTKDGQPIWTSVSSKITTDKQGKIFFDGVIEDITQRKLITDNLKKSIKKLRELDKQKSDFLAIASHELRSPITLISGYTSMILEDYEDQLPDEVKIQMVNIAHGAEKLNKILGDMLEITNIENKKSISTKNTKTCLKKVIREIEIQYFDILKKKEVNFTIDWPKCEHLNVSFDHDKLKMVFSNLIVNSLKSIDKKGKINIVIIPENNKMKIAVEDNGKGIPKKYHKKIFEKFTIIEPMCKKKEGLGLGLALCKQTIECFGGSIEVDSSYSQGARIVFYVQNYNT